MSKMAIRDAEDGRASEVAGADGVAGDRNGCGVCVMVARVFFVSEKKCQIH